MGTGPSCSLPGSLACEVGVIGPPLQRCWEEGSWCPQGPARSGQAENGPLLLG